MTLEDVRVSRRQMLAGLAAMAAPVGVHPAGASAATNALSTKPFTALFGMPVRGQIRLDRADYDVGYSTLTWNLSNIWLKGAAGGSRIHGTARTLLSLQNSHSCVFENITFEVTANTQIGSSYEAVVRSANALLRNHRFVQCRFVVRDAKQNALKLIAEQGDSRIESIHFEDCIIDGVGRMGIELQNHAQDSIERLIDFRWEGGAVRNTGLLSSAGMGISLSGLGSDHRINTLFENNRYAALENVGSSNSTFSGRSRLQTRGKVAPVSFTNTRVMRNNVIADFVCMDRASGSCRIWNQVSLGLRNNRFIVAGGVDFRGVAKLRSSGDRYDSTGQFVVSIQGYSAFGRPTQDNIWDAVTLDARATPPGEAVSAIRFAGSDTTNNILNNAIIWTAPGTAGKRSTQSISNAQGAPLSTNMIKGDTIVNGNRLKRHPRF